MLAVLEEPAIRARVPAMSVALYHRMYELGIVAPNVELIRGALVQKMPQSPLHASIVEMLRDSLIAFLPEGWCVRQEKPLTLADSEPEPDVTVVRGARMDFLNAHPANAQLVIEVAVSSEALDRVKLDLYAEAGVPESWLVLAEDRILERHTEPEEGRYRRVERVRHPASLESTVFPRFALPPAGLFPAR